MFEFLDHTADTAVRLTADDPAALIRSAADALRCIYLGEERGAALADALDLDTAARHRIELEAEDGEALLIDFLSELIFLFDTRRFLCGRVDIETLSLGRPSRLTATLVGTTQTEERDLQTEVKAATHHGVEIRSEGGRLTVDVVFDL